MNAEVESCGVEPRHEPENLPCPRCDSTNTKFCYYNNYNLSQPRYFCKSCRRFWTRGGTLRNVPVGGGTRKKSKRSRSSSSSSSSATSFPLSSAPAGIKTAEMISQLRNNDDLELDLNDETSFTSLLTTTATTTNNNANHVNGGMFTGLPGYGLELGFDIGSSGFADIGFGFGGSMTMSDETHVMGQNDGTNTWQFVNGDGMDGSDCFGWSDLTISTSGKGLE